MCISWVIANGCGISLIVYDSTPFKQEPTNRKSPIRRFLLHHLCHEAAHGLGGFILLLAGGVGVGAQGEARVVMAQHTADGFHVHAVLQGQRGECVSEIVKAYVRQTRIFQNFLMQVHDGVGVVHLPRDG